MGPGDELPSPRTRLLQQRGLASRLRLRGAGSVPVALPEDACKEQREGEKRREAAEKEECSGPLRAEERMERGLGRVPEAPCTQEPGCRPVFTLKCQPAVPHERAVSAGALLRVKPAAPCLGVCTNTALAPFSCRCVLAKPSRGEHPKAVAPEPRASPRCPRAEPHSAAPHSLSSSSPLAAESRAETPSRRAAEEADSLGEHPARWRDVAPWARADSEGLRRRLRELERALEQAQDDKRDMHQEMSRQHQELQRQAAAHSQRLEAKVKSLQEELARSLRESQESHEAATKALAERDGTIARLQGTMRAMESEYEQILHDSLDLVLAKLAEAGRHWEEQGTAGALQHKQRLQEFGLNPLEM
uniref:Dynein regulatory complex protein 12 n=1 Tax=Cairina moschata TaxID=8855 RepID=A0A8C3CFF9_CAIMO